GVLAHGIAFRKDAEWRVVGTGFHAHRVFYACFVDHFHRADAALRDALDLARPTRRDVAGLDPVVDDGTVELERARHVGLAAENLDESLSAVHSLRILVCPSGLDRTTFGLCTGLHYFCIIWYMATQPQPALPDPRTRESRVQLARVIV